MTTIGFARPSLLGEEPTPSGRSPLDLLAGASAALGVLAVASVAIDSLRIIGLPACGVAVILAFAAWRRSRGASQPVGLSAWAGLLLSVLSAVALVVAPAAFGSTSSGAAAPDPAVGISASPDANAPTNQVLAHDITVTFGAPHTELDDTGLVMATVPVMVKNITDRTSSYNLVFNATDPKGQLITTDSAFVPDVAPGQTAQVRVFNIVNSKMVPQLMGAHYSVAQATVQ